ERELTRLRRPVLRSSTAKDGGFRLRARLRRDKPAWQATDRTDSADILECGAAAPLFLCPRIMRNNAKISETENPRYLPNPSLNFRRRRALLDSNLLIGKPWNISTFAGVLDGNPANVASS